MDDRVDAFARLNRLRAEGVLTDAEYEREKALLMGNDRPLELGWRERWAAGREATSDMRRSLRWSFLGCVIVIALIGTYFFGKARTLAEARGEISGPAETASNTSNASGSLFGSESAWTIQTTTDPMTDATVNQASATFEGNRFNIEVGVSCSSTGDISYTATSFDKAGEPAEMRTEANWQRSWIPFQMRADDDQPLSWATSNPQYNNQISLNSEPVQFFMGKPVDDRAEGMAAASNIVLRLFMPTGEETIKWSQADTALRSLLTPCLSQRQAERDRLAAEQASKEREEAAERARAPREEASVNAM
jgi:hypothetical protein